MNETLVQGNDWLTWIEQFERDDQSASARLASTQSHSHTDTSHTEAWEQTDRLLQFPTRQQRSESQGKWNRARWLQKHDVRTEFLDAGIGTCWFAQQGDDEPVCGETEAAAIARLARQNGLPWHDM